MYIRRTHSLSVTIMQIPLCMVFIVNCASALNTYWQVAGYLTSWGRMAFATVRHAGHMVTPPAYQRQYRTQTSDGIHHSPSHKIRPQISKHSALQVPETQPQRALALFTRFIYPNTVGSGISFDPPAKALNAIMNRSRADESIIVAKVSGGTPPYIYRWHHGELALPHEGWFIKMETPAQECDVGGYWCRVSDSVGEMMTSG